LAAERQHLARLNFGGHPWARLLVACTLWDADCTDVRAREHAVGALQEFQRQGDGRGEGYSCFVLGSWAVTDGEINASGHWWEKARQLLGAASPANEITLAHRGLAAYADGNLTLAIAMAEESAALARLRGRPREEATALVNVGFFRLWSGDFRQALTALQTAEDAFDEVADPFDRYERPLCFAARGVLWALRGEGERAEADFDRGLQAARQVKEPWYEAIVRTLRAEFTAAADPRRARQDALWALTELDRRGEHWWRVWAAQAAGVAALEAGMYTAAETALRDVLDHDQAPLERARTLLLLGETLLRAGDSAESVALLRSAADTFEATGASYWAARAYARLASAEPTLAADWMARAKRAGTSDPAFRKLLLRTSQLRLAAFGPGRVLYGGQELRFHTDNATRAIFLLALAGPHGMHVEQLAEHLWSDRVERSRLLGRIRTLLWDARRGLGPEAWRLQRRSTLVALDLTGVGFDLVDLRDAARASSHKPTREPQALARQLRRPVLTRWAYDAWVVKQQDINERLVNQLVSR
jgi:tetratricopeptide (TPR) repeat protein